MEKTWIITGISQGLGLAVAEYLLNNEQKVAGTTRHLNKLDENLRKNPNLFVREVDITDEKEVIGFVAAAIKRFGTIDVLLNNAGYAKSGPFEELASFAIKQCYEVNVFATMNFCRAILPHFRALRKGVILNTSSVAAFSPNPGSSVYGATKAAVSNFSTALNAEVAALNIKVINVMPGAFRTNFCDKSSYRKNDFEFKEYDEIRNAKYNSYETLNHHQPGDPKRYATLINKLAEMKNPPKNIFVGRDAYEFAYKQLCDYETEMEQWKEDSLATGF